MQLPDLFKDTAWLEAAERAGTVPVFICTDRNYHFLWLFKRDYQFEDYNYLFPYRGPAADQFFSCLKDCITRDEYHLRYGDILINIDSFNEHKGLRADLEMIKASDRLFTERSLSATTGNREDDVEVRVAGIYEGSHGECMLIMININGKDRIWVYYQSS